MRLMVSTFCGRGGGPPRRLCRLIGGILLLCWSGGGLVWAEDATPQQAARDLEKIRQLLDSGTAITWLFTGDSVTQGVATHGHRDYTQLFELRVRWELLRKDDVVIKTAASGWTIASLDHRWQRYQETFAPAVVSISFGMNDCCGALNDPNTVSKWKQRFSGIIERIQATNAAVVLHAPNGMHPESSSGDVKRRKHLEDYVKVIRELARQHGAVLVDHYDCWQRYRKSDAGKRWMSDDIHPNVYGHRVMAQEMFKALGLYDQDSLTCNLVVPRYP